MTDVMAISLLLAGFVVGAAVAPFITPHVYRWWKEHRRD